MLVKVECDCFSCTLRGATHYAAVDNQSNRFGEEPERAVWSHSKSCGFPSLRAPGEKKKKTTNLTLLPVCWTLSKETKGIFDEVHMLRLQGSRPGREGGWIKKIHTTQGKNEPTFTYLSAQTPFVINTAEISSPPCPHTTLLSLYPEIVRPLIWE